MLDRIIGQDDLVGVMTPEMSAADISLARKTETIEGMLTKYWTWGQRHSIIPADDVERSYEQCYPDHKALVYEMVDRRREMLLLDALTDLVRHLHTLRDERKAILVFSEGWALFRPNQSLARPLKTPDGQDYPIPGRPEIGVTSDGKIATGNPRDPSRASLYKCDTDRMHLSHIDNDRTFKNLIDEANRANATFYPVDPRGLAVFDAPVGPRPPADVITDANNLRTRLESLRTLAAATDGIAVVDSNDLDRGLKRVSDDLSSYYLLGYYSTNTKLDGSYRSISVKLKRPGLEIRARRGYRAATADEIAKGKAAAPADVPADPEAAAVKLAIDAIASARPDLPIRVSAAVDRVSRPGETLVWVTGELDAKIAQSLEWGGGGTATVSIVAGRDTVAQGQASIETGARTFVIAVPAPLGAGDYRLQIRATPAAEGRALADGVALDVRAPEAAAPMIGAPLLFRKGPSTGNVFRPTADVRFRRNEAVRIEAAVSGDLKEQSATLLGRTGQPLRVPVTVEVVNATASAGSDPAAGRSGTWIAAHVSLAPLAPGDYAIAVTAKTGAKAERVVLGFRVIP